MYGLVLGREPNDVEALNLVARYALAADDKDRFAATLAKLNRQGSVEVAVHEPDVLAAAGRIDAAVQRYYTVEEAMPNNPSLALKIGRLAVLRHSVPMAGHELQKLSKSDPLYGYHMLSAYIAAEQQDRARAMKELAAAQSAAGPGDDSWTSAAEIHALFTDTGGVIESLEKAAQHKEPTALVRPRTPALPLPGERRAIPVAESDPRRAAGGDSHRVGAGEDEPVLSAES